MRRSPLLFLAAALLLATPLAYAGGGGGGSRPATYATPVKQKGRITQLRHSTTRPRGGWRGLRSGWSVQRGKLAPARALPETTFWIPGHTLGYRSLEPAMKHFLGNKANGTSAAVYIPKERVFRANGPKGRVMQPAEVAAAKLVTIEFTDAKAPADPKGKEIAAGMRLLASYKQPGLLRGERVPMRVVTHSAGDPQFRAALLDHIDPGAEGIKITGQIAVGSVFAGAWTGNAGNNPIGGLMGMRKAAGELAERSPFLARLDASRELIDARIEGPRLDIALEGAVPLTPKIFGKPKLGRGDGFVQSADVSRPGARTIIMRGIDPTPLNHLKQIGYSGVIKAIEDELAAP